MGVGAGEGNEIHVVWKWRGKYWAGFKRGGEKGDRKGRGSQLSIYEDAKLKY